MWRRRFFFSGSRVRAQRTLSPFLRLFRPGCPPSLRVLQRARPRGTLRGLDAVDSNFDFEEPGYGYGLLYSGCIIGTELYIVSIVFLLPRFFSFSLSRSAWTLVSLFQQQLVRSPCRMMVLEYCQ